MDVFRSIKGNAVHAAKDLHYGDDVITKIEKAESPIEIERIMRAARHEKFEGVKTNLSETKVGNPPRAVKATIKKQKTNEQSSGETYKCSEVQEYCTYSTKISNGAMFCNFLCITKERRGCDPEKCNKFKPKKGKNIVRLKL